MLPFHASQVRIDGEDRVRTAAQKRQRPKPTKADIAVDQYCGCQRIELYRFVVQFHFPEKLESGFCQALPRDLRICGNPMRALSIGATGHPLGFSPAQLGLEAATEG